jgi:hypothetical protein
MYDGNKFNQSQLAEIKILLRKAYLSGKRNLYHEHFVLRGQEILSRGKRTMGSIYVNALGALNHANMLDEQTY